MDDLVERLEQWPQSPDGADALDARYVAMVMQRALAEIRSLREQVAQDRAGIVAWMRAHGKWPRSTSHAGILADALEAQQDKEPTT